jgi:hypothetical protein
VDPLVGMAKEVAITAIIDEDSRDKLCFAQMIAMIHLKMNTLLSRLDNHLLPVHQNKTMIQKHKNFQ